MGICIRISFAISAVATCSSAFYVMQTMQLTLSFAHIFMIAGIFGLSCVLAVVAMSQCTTYRNCGYGISAEDSCWQCISLSDGNIERARRAYYALCAFCAIGILTPVLAMLLAGDQETMSMLLLYVFTGVFSVISIILASIMCCSCCLNLFSMAEFGALCLEKL